MQIEESYKNQNAWCMLQSTPHLHNKAHLGIHNCKFSIVFGSTCLTFDFWCYDFRPFDIGVMHFDHFSFGLNLTFCMTPMNRAQAHFEFTFLTRFERIPMSINYDLCNQKAYVTDKLACIKKYEDLSTLIRL